MNTQVIEQLREALQGMCELFERDFPTVSKHNHESAYNKAKEALASLPTAQPTEVYIPVSVEDELPEERDLYACEIRGKHNGCSWFRIDYLDFCAGSFTLLREHEKVTRWLKPTKAILIPE